MHKFLGVSEFVHEFLNICVQFFSFVVISCTNSYANSYVNLVHEIRTKFVILGRISKNSYEFACMYEGYVINGLYCR